MKKTFIMIAILAMGTTAQAQGVRISSLRNSSDSKVEIMQGPINLRIIGHVADAIKIETDYVRDKAANKGLQQIGEKPAAGEPERAKGLKPLSAAGLVNTDVGLNVEKSPGAFRILGIAPDALDHSYTIYIPDQASLIVHDINPATQSQLHIEQCAGELNLTLLNSSVKMEAVDGPVIVQTTNGNVEIVYDGLEPQKANSITSVNGFVDITLPRKIGVNVTLNSINGEAFTDFDIQVDKNNAPAMVPNLEMTMVEGVINGGGIPFTISTVNGDIYLRKGK